MPQKPMHFEIIQGPAIEPHIDDLARLRISVFRDFPYLYDGSHEYEATPPCYPAKVTPRLAERLGTVAKEAFRQLGCRDYARVDFRVLPTGQPYVLEVNPNPDFSPLAGFAGGLKASGRTHEQFTLDLVTAAYQRGQARASAVAGNGEHPGTVVAGGV